MKRFEIFFGLIKIPVDFAMTILAFLAAYQLRLLTEPIEGIAKAVDYTVLPTMNEYINFSAKMTLILLVIFAVGKMYSLKTTHKFSEEMKKTTLLCIIWAMTMITIFFFQRIFPFSRLAIIYSWGLAFILVIFGRALIRGVQIIFLKNGVGKRNLIFIGTNRLTEDIGATLKTTLEYNIIGIVRTDETTISSKLKDLGTIENLEQIIKSYKVDEAIQTKDFSEIQNEEILETCDLNHVIYRFVPNLVEMRRKNIETETIGKVPVISLHHTPLDGWGKIVKRIGDIVGATLGILILSPIFLLTAIAIKLDSRGPVFFTTLDDGSSVKRVGQYGKLFKFVKFRSMFPKTDSLRYTKLANSNMRTDGPLVKIKDDPRITRVGKFIRKFSIDELPQLWNVIVGNLSLVGPRPHLPEEVAKYKKHHKFVLTIKPGLSGLAQISGRSELSFEDEIKLDRYYIENWSMWLDIKIILKTFLVVLMGYKE